MNCDQIKKLVDTYSPALLFSQLEHFFPIPVEAWFSHCTTETPWNEDGNSDRGTAIVVVPRNNKNLITYADLNPIGGCPSPNATPIDPNNIGKLVAQLPDMHQNDVFVDFGGWHVPLNDTQPDFTKGSRNYDAFIFSLLDGAVNPVVDDSQASNTKDPPIQPTNLAVYVEIEWAGHFTRLDIKNGTNNFPSAPTANQNNPTPIPDLDNYLVVTFYYFYPVTDTPPGNPASPPPLREGQWEALTLYFEGRTDGEIGNNLRPGDFNIATNEDGSIPPPVWAVFSQGIKDSGSGLETQGVDGLPAEVRPYQFVHTWQLPPPKNTKRGTTLAPTSNWPQSYPFGPFVWVTSGTHKNKFTQWATITITSGSSPTNVSATISGGAAGLAGLAYTLGSSGTGGAVLAGLLGAAAAQALAAAAAFLWPFLAFLAVCFFLLALPDLLNNYSPESSTDSPKGGDQADGTGPAAAPSSVQDPQNDLQSSTGSQMIGQPSNYVTFTTKIVNNFDLNGEKCKDLVAPPWWKFPGRWGVWIQPVPLPSWDGGSRRFDPLGRSRAYWNTVQLVEYWSARPNAKDPNTPPTDLTKEEMAVLNDTFMGS